MKQKNRSGWWWKAILLAIFPIISIILVVTKPSLPNWLSILCDTLAALSLAGEVALLVLHAPQNDRKNHTDTILGKLLGDTEKRTMLTTTCSFVVNEAFALMKGIAGWHSSSFWLVTLACYYFVLSLAKLLLIRDNKKLESISDEGKRSNLSWNAYRRTGILFLPLTLILEGMVVLIMKNGKTFAYHGIFIYAMATYDFYALVSAILFVTKKRKNHTPVIRAVKAVSLATSLVSMLSLQTAMFASFSKPDEMQKRDTMNLLTGNAVCILLAAIGIFMLITARKAQRLTPSSVQEEAEEGNR
jgi:hypothetical protein